MAICGEASFPSGASAQSFTKVDTLVGFTFDGKVAALATGLNVPGPIYADACFFGGTAYPHGASADLTNANAAILGWDGTTTSLTAGLNVPGPLYATACHCGGVEYPASPSSHPTSAAASVSDYTFCSEPSGLTQDDSEYPYIDYTYGASCSSSDDDTDCLLMIGSSDTYTSGFMYDEDSANYEDTTVSALPAL